MAPAFDLNPDPSPGTKYFATAIDSADDAADLDVALSVADMFRLDHQQAIRIIAEVTDAVVTWRPVAAKHGLPPSQLEAMAPAFAATDRAQELMTS